MWWHSVAVPRSHGWVCVHNVWMNACRTVHVCGCYVVCLRRTLLLNVYFSLPALSPGMFWPWMAATGSELTSLTFRGTLRWINKLAAYFCLHTLLLNGHCFKLRHRGKHNRLSGLSSIAGPGGGEHLEALRWVPSEAESAGLPWRGRQRSEVNLTWQKFSFWLRLGPHIISHHEFSYPTVIFIWLLLSKTSFIIKRNS